MNQKKLEALAKRNAAKATKVQKQRSRTYDATLDATRSQGPEDDEGEALRLFREMKRREF
jgi:hypothetical protein